MIRLVGGQCTDVGRTRSSNQDAALVAPELAVFAVADGMGGHRGGEVASALAVEELAARAREALGSVDGVGGRLGSVDDLVDAVLAANERVFDRSCAIPDLRGMGTTLCAVALVGSGTGSAIGLANVGDSRVYVLQDGALTQLTEDHSLVQGLVRQGQLTEAEAAAHPMRNVVTRVIGVEADVEVDWWERPVVVGDRYLLCSDGLFNEVGDARIAATLRLLADPVEAARALVVLANDGGGRDNITCVVVDVVGEDEPPALDPGPTAAAALAAALAPAPERVSDPSPALRPRRVTGRALAFVFGLVVLLAVAVLAVRVWSRHSYFVADGGGGRQLVIYRGRPDGVLWFDPEPVAVVEVGAGTLTPAQLERLPHQTSSLDEARTWVSLLGVPASTVATVATSPSSATAKSAPASSAPGPTTVSVPVPSVPVPSGSGTPPATASPPATATGPNAATPSPPTTGG